MAFVLLLDLFSGNETAPRWAARSTGIPGCVDKSRVSPALEGGLAMHTPTWVLVAPIVLTPLLAPVAAAQSNPDYGRNGFYVALAGLYAFEDFGGDIPRLTPPFSVDDGLGMTGRIGWRFTRWTAVELSGEYASFDAEEGGGTFSSDFNTVAGVAHLKGILPLGRVEPYALFGVGALTLAVTDISNNSGFAWRGGLGVQVHATRHLAAFLEGSYLGTTGDVSNLPYGGFVWGLQWRF